MKTQNGMRQPSAGKMQSSPKHTVTNLIRFGFRKEPTGDIKSVHCVYSWDDNSLGQITDERAGQIALTKVFAEAEDVSTPRLPLSKGNS